MCRIFRAGDNYIAALNMPAQDDLCAALPIFPGQFGKQRLLLKRLIAMSQGVLCLDYDSLFIQEPFQFFFLRVRVRLRLQDGRLNLTDAQNFLDLLLIEVGQADRFYLAFFAGLLHLPVTGYIVPGGLVNQ